MFKGGMAMNGMQGMLKKVQKMQSEMTKLQEELKEREVEGTAGGEAVKAVVNGNKNLVSLTLSPDAVDPEDVEMLQDLIVTADLVRQELFFHLRIQIIFQVGFGLFRCPYAAVPGGSRYGLVLQAQHRHRDSLIDFSSFNKS